jgi:hypothetical protein
MSKLVLASLALIAGVVCATTTVVHAQQVPIPTTAADVPERIIQMQHQERIDELHGAQGAVAFSTSITCRGRWAGHRRASAFAGSHVRGEH